MVNLKSVLSVFLCLILANSQLVTTSSIATEATSPASPTGPVTQHQPGPNILLIVVDDLGYSDLGVYGSEINTPNLDQLARSGILFTDFYSASVCSPTRSMLLTGIDNHLVGLGNMAESLTPNQRGQPGYEGYLNFKVAPLADLLKDAGYRTYMTGKWHLGLDKHTSPAARGFEKSFALIEGGAGHFDDLPALGPGKARFRENGNFTELPEDFYSTRFYTRKLQEYIESGRHDNQPFFAYLAYTAPHFPLQAPEKTIEKYHGKYDMGYDVVYEQRLDNMKSLGLIHSKVAGVPRAENEPAWEELSRQEKKISARKMEIYAAMIDDIDHYIGELIDYLKRTRQFDNTFIFFMSDNGPEGHHLEKAWPQVVNWIYECCDNSYANLGKPNSYTWYGPNWGRVSAAPFLHYKGFTSEGGIRVPAFVSYPGKLPVNQVFHEVVSVKDVMPTLLELAGVTHPEEYKGRNVLPIQGKSLLTALSNEHQQFRDDNDFFGTESYGRRAIRKGDWKILLLPPPQGQGQWQLFNLISDPSEQHDIADQYPDKLQELSRLWLEYSQNNHVILPNKESVY